MPPTPPPPDRKADAAGTVADRAAIEWLIRLQDAPDDLRLRRDFALWCQAPCHARSWARLQRTDGALRAADIRRGTMRRRAGLGVLAAVTVCAACLLAPEAMLRWQADAMTGTGQTRLVTLADGSIVHLAPDSAVALADRDGERRVALLRGTAWFDVIRDPQRPFRVVSGDITTTVLGTAFEVRRDAAAEAIISVRRGAVRVDCAPPHAPARRVAAGQSLGLRCGGHASLAEVAPERIAPWVEGQVVADDISLRLAIDAVRPWYGGIVVARGARLDRTHVTGVYDLRHPGAALEALAVAGHARIDTVTPWITIVTAD